MSADIDALLDPRTGERLRELLEDFDVIATRTHMAIIPNDPYSQHLHKDVRAAVVASTLRLSSLDYARRQYVHQQVEQSTTRTDLDCYRDAYRAAKAYTVRMFGKLNTDNRPEPTMGEFGASIAIQRLIPSLFSAHVMYQLGHKYEGHAISRLMLEQIAWANVARELDDVTQIAQIETTKSITELKKLMPESGRLYGYLSSNVHIDYSNHHEFISVDRGYNVILHGLDRFEEFATVILTLADLLGVVWELSQHRYIYDLETIEMGTLTGKFGVIQDRPFGEVRDNLLKQFS